MDKKLRKEIEQQIATTINEYLRTKDEGIFSKMEKVIKSSSKDLAKKFVRIKLAIAEELSKKLSPEKPAVKKKAAKKSTAKNASAKKVKAKTAIKAKKTAAKKTKAKRAVKK